MSSVTNLELRVSRCELSDQSRPGSTGDLRQHKNHSRRSMNPTRQGQNRHVPARKKDLQASFTGSTSDDHDALSKCAGVYTGSCCAHFRCLRSRTWRRRVPFRRLICHSRSFLPWNCWNRRSWPTRAASTFTCPSMCFPFVDSKDKGSPSAFISASTASLRAASA